MNSYIFSFIRLHNLHRYSCRSLDIDQGPYRTVLELIRAEISHSLLKAFGPEFRNHDPLVLPSKIGKADYQSNIAMPLGKTLKITPREVAQKVLGEIRTGKDSIIGHADISGPGFINVHISMDFLKKRILSKASDIEGRLGIPKVMNPQKIVVDFSSPNIAKEMHVGHLRSTIIGDSLCRVLEFQGHQVLRLNHVGDWGTQFGMLIHYLRTHHELLLKSTIMESPSTNHLDLDIGDLSAFYKAAKIEFDESENFRDASRKEVVNLQQCAANGVMDRNNMSTPSSIDLWKLICRKSREKFQEIYDLLKVSLIERGESFYNPMLADLVAECRRIGVVQESEGALVIFPPGFVKEDGNPLPLIIQKSDGGYLYATTDLAALKHRIDIEKADRLIYVTDAGQSQHFQMVFAAAKLAGILPSTEDTSKSVTVNHVTFGLVQGQDGKKIKSRSGETIRLQDLLEEAMTRAKDGFVSRLKESNDQLSSTVGEKDKELEVKAKSMGIAAVKYADLAMNRESNYKFSFDKMLSLTGNTAPYMLYAYVRIEGIKRKALASIATADRANETNILHTLLHGVDASGLDFTQSEEIVLAKHLLRSDEILRDVEDNLYPNKVRNRHFCTKVCTDLLFFFFVLDL